MSCGLASANVCNDTLNPAQHRHDVLCLFHLVLVERERERELHVAWYTMRNASQKNIAMTSMITIFRGANQCKAIGLASRSKSLPVLQQPVLCNITCKRRLSRRITRIRAQISRNIAVITLLTGLITHSRWPLNTGWWCLVQESLNLKAAPCKRHTSAFPIRDIGSIGLHRCQYNTPDSVGQWQQGFPHHRADAHPDF